MDAGRVRAQTQVAQEAVRQAGTSGRHFAAALALEDESQGGILNRAEKRSGLSGGRRSDQAMDEWLDGSAKPPSKTEWFSGVIGRLILDQVDDEARYAERKRVFLDGLAAERRVAVEGLDRVLEARVQLWEDQQLLEQAIRQDRIEQMQVQLEALSRGSSRAVGRGGSQPHRRSRSVVVRGSPESEQDMDWVPAKTPAQETGSGVVAPAAEELAAEETAAEKPTAEADEAGEPEAEAVKAVEDAV